MKLNKNALRRACLRAADSALWEKGPRPVEPIQQLADQFYQIAVENESFLIGQGRDPNIVTRAVRYLALVHAIPVTGQDTHWFTCMLQVLIELACPNTAGQRANDKFYSDIENGIIVARSDYKRIPKS